MNESPAGAAPARCRRCHWPAFRTVTVTAGQETVYNGPTCRSCLNSIQQDGRYFTASIQIGPVMAGDGAEGGWSGAPRPASMAAQERERLVYRVAADAGQALSAVPGWEVERSGTCLSIRFKGHGPRRHGDPPDYFAWLEDAASMDLHKAIEASVRRRLEHGEELFDVEDGPRCFHCGCTDEEACPGGCAWVPGPVDGDLCSRCAAELALLAAALDDAAGYRDLRGSGRCEACARAAGGRCAEHQPDAARAASYRKLLADRYSIYLASA